MGKTSYDNVKHGYTLEPSSRTFPGRNRQKMYMRTHGGIQKVYEPRREVLGDGDDSTIGSMDLLGTVLSD